jgi:tetratricopeptide (TPR) repeat protein
MLLRKLLISLAISSSLLGVAGADELQGRLAALSQAAPGQPRIDAANAVIQLGPSLTPAIIARLGQPRTATNDEKRAVLSEINAEVVNDKGVFVQPPRPKNPKAPELDWLAELARLPPSPVLSEVLEVVALLRALGEARTEAAADAILAFGFSPDGLVYRDECGRTLRKMSPHSLPTLLRASHERKRDAGNYARYANYQLDRLSMNRPSYALAAALDDRMEVAMLRAIRDVRHPDAVTAVLDRVDAPSTAVRRAARETWLAYVTGPPPPPAPKAFRKLPGGKLSPEPLPLYLTYRELAEQELRRVLLQQTGKEPDRRLNGDAMTRMLFGLYDQRRNEASDARVAAARPLADAGKWEEVGAHYDALLHEDPLYVRRAAMAPGYIELGKLHASRRQWDAAIVAFHKALALDPDGASATSAQAELAAARAGREQAAGRSAAEDLAAAAAADPTRAADTASPARSYLLYGGILVGVVGLAMLIAGLLMRRGRIAHGP